MRATPHYPPPQPNTSARMDYDSHNNSYAPSHSSYRDESYPAEGVYAAEQQQQSRQRMRAPQTVRRVPQQQQQQQRQQPPQEQLQQRRLSADHAPPMNDDFKSVVYTVQDTYTDTQAHETDCGGVLTIRTTTVTRTITERLVRSDEDEDSSDEEEGGAAAV